MFYHKRIVLPADNNAAQRQLDNYGRMGWALVSVTSKDDGSEIAYFRRQDPPRRVRSQAPVLTSEQQADKALFEAQQCN